MGKNAKIGIITWHYFFNVGSNFQAYALQHTLESLGRDVRIINYRRGHVSIARRIKGYIRYSLCNIYSFLPEFGKTYLGFEKFQKDYMHLTPLTNKKDIAKYNQFFDVFICGSDQVWAPNVLDDVFLLSFVKKDKRKVSYAASIGLPSIPESKKSVYRQYLPRFDAVSVRERQGAELLKKEFQIDAEVVLDPTLLMKPEDWRKMTSQKRIVRDNYIYCYFRGKQSWQIEYVKEIARQTGKKIVISSLLKIDKKEADVLIPSVHPMQFLSLIHDADLVFTDSFHGMAFSLIFHKSFYVFYRFTDNDPVNQNSRIDNLKTITGLQDRIITDKNAVLSQKPIDYDDVDRRLDEERKKTLCFLEKAIQI